MTSTIEQFKEDLEIGQVYEQLFFALLVKSGYNPKFAPKGEKKYDIEASGLKFEIKKDSYTKNNGRIALEIWSNKRLNHKGWISYSEANVLIYFISGTEYYWIDFKYLRETIGKTLGMYEEIQSFRAGNPDAYCYMVPLSHLKKEKVILKRTL